MFETSKNTKRPWTRRARRTKCLRSCGILLGARLAGPSSPAFEPSPSAIPTFDSFRFPSLHLYAAKDPRLVEEKKMTRKRLSGFQKLLCDYEQGYCSLEQLQDENGDEFWSTSNPYTVLP